MTPVSNGAGARKSAYIALVFLLCVCLAFAALQTACAAGDAGAGDAGKAESPKAPAPAPLEIMATDRGISIYAEEVQADELFTRLARTCGVGIIVDDTVGRREGDKFTSRQITLNLNDRTLDEIIAGICTAYGLSHSRVGKVYMISEGIPKNPSSYLMSDITSVTTEYLPSAQVKSLLPEFLQAHVKVNEGKNAVVLSAPAEVLEKFRNDIRQFDVPAAQIMIDVTMVEFTDAAARELGFDFLWSNAGRSTRASSATGDVIFRVLGTLPNEFTAAIKALHEKRIARVHANPRIATVSGQKASVFVGRQRYLSQPVEVAGGQIMNFIDAGIKLDMTPWTGGGEDVITEVSAEVSVMSAPDPITRLPEKSTRRVNTQVRVRQGETIIIGGLVQRELQTSRSKIPALGEIPAVGALFQSRSASETKTELVIFITPRILTEEHSLSEQQKRELLEQFEPGPRERPEWEQKGL